LFDDGCEWARGVVVHLDIAEPTGDPNQRGVTMPELAVRQPDIPVARVPYALVAHAAIFAFHGQHAD
jgi:hypothetical protein